MRPEVTTVRDLRRTQILAEARSIVAQEGLAALTIGTLEKRLPFSRGVITRWELPVPVRVDPPVRRETVEQALRYWQARTGITFVLTDMPEPSILVRSGTDGLPGTTGRGLVDGVYPNNRARTGLVVMHPDIAGCDFTDARCAFYFEHEMGHTLGMLDHVAGGGIMSSGLAASQREIDILMELYRLPHGVRVDPDGTWAVVVD